MVLPSLSKDKLPGGDNFGVCAENITKFAATAAKYGIRILYHNHDFEFDKVGNCYKFDLLYSALPAGVLDTEIDTCWVKVGGESPTDYLKNVNKVYMMPDVYQNIPNVLAKENMAGSAIYYNVIQNTGGMMIIMPLIILYLFCQKYLVQGIERSGLVG